MPLRLIEVYHNSIKDIENFLKNVEIIDMWHEKILEKRYLTRMLLPMEKSEEVINKLQKHFSKYEDFRIIILPVEASIPPPEIQEKEEGEEERISIEEIYQDLIEVARITKTYIVLVILASIVASIGILYNDVAVIIGSMVIAPLLSPNMALSLATTLADYNLAKRSVLTSFVGYAIAFITGIIFGMAMKNVYFPQILSRLNMMYILLAFSAGIAGSLSMTKGIAQALVGVMVAVALLPPIVASGLLLGSMNWEHALASFLLFSVNVVCINLAGVLTFIIQGISPRTWWKKKKAKKTVWEAVLIWLFLLTLLIMMILFYNSLFK